MDIHTGNFRPTGSFKSWQVLAAFLGAFRLIFRAFLALPLSVTFLYHLFFRLHALDCACLFPRCLRRSSSLQASLHCRPLSTMARGDETVEQLRDLVSKLEARMDQLESRLQQADSDVKARSTKSPSEALRIILMGPPGAGKPERIHSGRRSLDSRQRYSGTEAKREVLRMSFGKSGESLNASSF